MVVNIGQWWLTYNSKNSIWEVSGDVSLIWDRHDMTLCTVKLFFNHLKSVFSTNIKGQARSNVLWWTRNVVSLTWALWLRRKMAPHLRVKLWMSNCEWYDRYCNVLYLFKFVKLFFCRFWQYIYTETEHTGFQDVSRTWILSDEWLGWRAYVGIFPST